MSNLVTMSFKFPDWPKKVLRAKKELALFQAAQIQFNRGMLFDKEGAYNGRPRWAELKFRNGMILSKRGTLRKSIAPINPKGSAGPDGIVRFSGDKITVGTSLMYARLMNDGTTKLPGGVLRPVKAKALMIPLPNGKAATDAAKSLRKGASSLLSVNPKTGRTQKTNVIFRKWVRIPARPFDDWTAEDQNEFEIAVENKVWEVLGRD